MLLKDGSTFVLHEKDHSAVIRLRVVDIKDWWDQIARRRPSTLGKWTGIAQSLRTVQCHIVSIGAPIGMPKSRRNSLEAELRWRKNWREAACPIPSIRYLPEEWPRHLVWAKAVTTTAGHDTWSGWFGWNVGIGQYHVLL